MASKIIAFLITMLIMGQGRVVDDWGSERLGGGLLCLVFKAND